MSKTSCVTDRSIGPTTTKIKKEADIKRSIPPGRAASAPSSSSEYDWSSSRPLEKA